MHPLIPNDRRIFQGRLDSVSLRHNGWDITLNHRARRLTVELVPGFMALVQGLPATMTVPSFASLTTVLTGWVFASRHTVT